MKSRMGAISCITALRTVRRDAAPGDSDLDGFRHFKFGSGQHDAAGGIAVDEVQNGRDIVHHRFADSEAGRRAGRFHEGIGMKGADHAVTIRVPRSSPARILSSTPSLAPGAMRTWATPAARALNAAFSLASIPPVAMPSEISWRLSAAVRSGRTCLEPSSTP